MYRTGIKIFLGCVCFILFHAANLEFVCAQDIEESTALDTEAEIPINGWYNESGETYYYINGVPVQGEILIDQNWYYFDVDTNAMVTGFQKVGSRTVYYDEAGRMTFGEKMVDNDWYYFHPDNGDMQTGFQKVGSRTVYYAPTGEMLFGKQLINEKEYFFNINNGNQYIGLFTDDEGITKCYAQEGGYVSGEICIDGNWYYFHEDTKEMLTGFQKVGSRTVYYDEAGQMTFGEKMLGNNWYYFHPNNGNMQTGFQKVGRRIVYYAPTGEMLFGRQIIDDKVFMFDVNNGNQYVGLFTDDDGKIKCYAPQGGYVAGEICVNGNWYYFDKETNEMITGLQNVGSRTVYYNEDGTMAFGEKMLNGKWYYFHPNNGAMQTGFQKIGSRTVYYAATGEMLFGSQRINGNKYYFNPNNGNMLVSGWYNDEYYGSDGVCIGAVAGKIEELKKYTYVPYVWGGTSTMGWDCSGFTQWALNFIADLRIPRLAQDQALGGTYVNPNNMYVWKPGDVLCYSTGGSISHVAIYLGDGMLMHALNERYGTLIQSVEYYERWDGGTYLSGVRRYF